MRTLHISVLDKKATYLSRDGDIVCGNSDYIIEFAFDAEWDAYEEKTARFIWNGNYQDVKFVGTACYVPIVTHATELKVGVYAGELSTTTSASIGCTMSVLCESSSQGGTIIVDGDSMVIMPVPTEDDNGKVLTAQDRKAEWKEPTGGDGLIGVTEDDNGKILIVENGKWVLGYPPSSSGSGSYVDPYTQISITSFKHNAGADLREYGEVIPEVVFSWSLNKDATSLSFDGEKIDANLTTKTLQDVSLSDSDKSWTLVAVDERNIQASKSVSIALANGVYYGVAAEPSEYNSAFILGLTKTLSKSRVSPIDVNAGDSEYIYYALPKRIGECSFTINNYTGGFSLVDTISFENAHGYTEDYYIYKSDAAGRGAVTVYVTANVYTPISIQSFSHNLGSSSIEYRNTIDSVTLSWSLNKDPASLSLDGESVDVKATSKVLTDVPVTSGSITWTLAATDEQNAERTKSASVSFVNGVYYGAAAEPAEYDSAFILGLTKKLSSGKVSSFTVNAGTGKYIYYAQPARYGTCEFTVGTFTGGFDLVKQISFTNAYGYTETYYIYRSDYDNLGQCTVKVS